LEYNERINDMDDVVKMTEKELYDLGKITKYQVYELFNSKLNKKIEDKLSKFYKYPMQEMGTWNLKKEQSIRWLSISEEEKKQRISISNFVEFDILIAESIENHSASIEEKISKINNLATIILEKYSELEKIFGESFQLRNIKKEKLKEILNQDDIDHYSEMEKILEDI